MKKNNKKDKISASERIINTAEALFYSEGIQSVGIDRIVEESNVALNTMYKYFSSKDKLVEAYLEDRDIKWMNWLNSYIEKEDAPVNKVLAIFHALEQWFHEDQFRGCAFINASGELGHTKPSVYEISKKHKETLYKTILDILMSTHIEQKEKVAKQLMILIEGSIVQAYLNEEKEAALYAKEIAKILLTKDSDTNSCV